jgi:tetratricopeptide (TPR) repeat protein
MEQGLSYFEEIGQFGGMGRALQNLGLLCAAQQNYPDAARYYRQALRLFTKTGQIQPVLEAVYEVARLLQTMGEHEYAVERYSLIIHHPRMRAPERRASEEHLAALKTRLSPEIYAAAVEQGKRLMLDEAVKRLVENEDWQNLP